MFKINKLKLFTYLLITLALYFSFIIFNFNSEINNYLAFNQKSQNTLIYFESKKYYQNGKFNLTDTINELKNRNFRKSNDNLVNSYQLKDSLLIIQTPEFIDWNGLKYSSRKVAIDFTKKRIISLDEGENSFTLLPYPIISKSNNGVTNKSYLPLKDIPLKLRELLIKNEDKNFYSHAGVDLIAILRALYINIKSLKYKQGASTITQQVSKNLFLKREKTITRKFKELIFTLLLEYKLEKDQILNIYLNEVYLGQRGNNAIYGVGKASKVIFNKDISSLNKIEIASLVALIKEPGVLSTNPKKLKEKAISILKGKNSTFKKTTAKYRKPSFKTNHSKYFNQALISNVSKKFNFKNLKYLKIYTGISEKMQTCATKTVSKKLKKFPYLNVGLVSLNPKNGLVKAWVGGKNFLESQFDRVNQSKRQIGSLIKPFIYLKSLEDNEKLNPQSTILDIPISVKLKNGKSWNPNNYDNKFLGPITLRKALEISRNMPAILTLKEIGVKKFLKYLKPIANADIEDNPTVALGTMELSLIDITSAYTVFANNGKYVKPRLFKSLIKKGKFIENKTHEVNFANEGSSFLINSILNGVVSSGTAKKLREYGVSTNLSGKTGTTNNGKDFWFIGYTPKLITGLWIGRDDNKKTKLSSSDALIPIYGEYLSCIGKDSYDFNKIIPNEIELVTIDKSTQLIPTEDCPAKNTSFEFYRKKHKPREGCSLQ